MKREQNKPIDFVIPWVDGSDPKWQNEKSLYEAHQIGTIRSCIL